MDEIVLRPHHLLCLPRFRGEGYSKEFIERASELLKKLQEPNTNVILVRGADDLCETCPLLEECTDGEAHDLANALDNNVLEATQLPLGVAIPSATALDGVAKAFPTVNVICQGCQWLETCLDVERDFS